jgi:hypothetical protein
MPSQRSSRATLALGRTLRSNGTITVGPVTTTRAPNSSASSKGRFSRPQADSVTTPQVISAPQVTSRRTVFSRPRISLKRRVRAPSNRMIDTARDTPGSSRSPNNCLGWIRPATEPNNRPDSSNGKMAGSLMRQEAHWQTNATTVIRANCKGTESSMGFLV